MNDRERLLFCDDGDKGTCACPFSNCFFTPSIQLKIMLTERKGEREIGEMVHPLLYSRPFLPLPLLLPSPFPIETGIFHAAG